MKKILIIEPKISHWTTVEPLIVCFLKKGWKVEVLIPESFISIFNYYSKLHHIDKYLNNLTLNKFTEFNLLLILLRPRPDISIIANRLFYEKPLKISFLNNLKIILLLTFRSIIKLLLIKYRFNKSYFIITTHFVDFYKLPENIFFANSNNLYTLLNYVWNKSRENNDGINVYSSLVKEYIEEEDNKKVFVAPNAIYRYSNKINKINKNKFSIIIPGRIDIRRRYYEWIDKLDSNWIDKIDIKFIGKAQSDHDLEIVKKLDKKGFNQYVKRTNQFIDFDEFDLYLETADLLFVPLVKLDNKKRGIDRNLGAFFDSVRYGKPLIIPDSVPVAAELADNILTYKNDDHLFAMIEKIISDLKYFDSISSKAIDNSMNWAPNNITYPNDLIEQLN